MAKYGHVSKYGSLLYTMVRLTQEFIARVAYMASDSDPPKHLVSQLICRIN